VVFIAWIGRGVFTHTWFSTHADHISLPEIRWAYPETFYCDGAAKRVLTILFLAPYVMDLDLAVSI